MDVLEIVIQRKTEDGCPVVVEYHQTGEFLSSSRKEGLLRLDIEALKQIESDVSEALQYGEILGKALFQDQIRDVFIQARAANQGGLRLLLVIEEPSLRGLHWECLCG